MSINSMYFVINFGHSWAPKGAERPVIGSQGF